MLYLKKEKINKKIFCTLYFYILKYYTIFFMQHVYNCVLEKVFFNLLILLNCNLYRTFVIQFILCTFKSLKFMLFNKKDYFISL